MQMHNVQVSLRAFLRNWITTYLGNMLGAFAGVGFRVSWLRMPEERLNPEKI